MKRSDCKNEFNQYVLRSLLCGVRNETLASVFKITKTMQKVAQPSTDLVHKNRGIKVPISFVQNMN